VFIADLREQHRGGGQPRREAVRGRWGRQGGTADARPADSSSLDAPEGVAVDSRGELFIADSYNGVVEEVSPAGRLSVLAVTIVRAPPLPARTGRITACPDGVAVGAQGDLLIADGCNDVVEEITPAGRFRSSLGTARWGCRHQGGGLIAPRSAPVRACSERTRGLVHRRLVERRHRKSDVLS
jgi:hypothetical protein